MQSPTIRAPLLLRTCCGVSTPLMPQETARDLGQGGAEQKFLTRDLTDGWKFESRRGMWISVVVRSNESDPTVQLVRIVDGDVEDVAVHCRRMVFTRLG